MIAASEPQEFIPFGRQQVLEHPGAVQIGIQEHQHHSENALSSRLSEVAITDNSKHPESWILRETKHEAIECEEELYYKGKTVVWSIGPASTDSRTNKILKCCYTSESLVQEALWCNFHLSSPDISSTFLTGSYNLKLADLESKIPTKENDELKNCICIVDTNNIKFYTKSGKEYMTTLQFQVNKLWAMKYGLIFERSLEKKDSREAGLDEKTKKTESPIPSPPSFRIPFRSSTVDLRRQSIEQSFIQNQRNISDFDKSLFSSTHYLNLPSQIHGDFSPVVSSVVQSDDIESETAELPTIFSLSHPLDEICPVVSKHENLSYISNPDVKIIFTSESPSLCMMYDRKMKVHSVYFIRKALPQESEVCLHRESMLSRTSRSQNSFSNVAKPSLSNTTNNSFTIQNGNVSLPFLNARTRKSLGLSHSAFPNLASSPFNSYEHTRHSSPIPSRSALSPAFSYNHYTPSPRRLESSFSTPHEGTPSRIENRMMNEDIEYAEPKPLYPQICLQHVWSEPSSNDNSASKAFLTTDLIGQTYLCYLLKAKHILHLLKIKINSDESCVIFGDVSTINAKDACELTSLDMLAVIGLDGGIQLYSGPALVGKILISGVPSCVATSSYLSNSNAGPTFFTRASSSAFPKRSSLIVQSVSHLSPVFNDSLTQLSPVTSLDLSGTDKLTPNLQNKTPVPPSTPREGTLIALKDSLASRVSLEFSTGILFRTQLPDFGNSPLVKSCLNVLRQVLPNDLSLHLSIKWYCTRNAPGAHNVEPGEEWIMFSDVLFGLLGYDVEALKGIKIDAEKSPVIRPKKQKTSETNGDEDWNYLLDSKHHEFCFDHVKNVLGFGLNPTDKSTDSEMQDDTESYTGITETPLISSRSSSFNSKLGLFDVTQTPIDRSKISHSKFKSSFVKIQEKSLESIDETPIQPKNLLNKSRLPMNRFQSILEQGDVSPITVPEPSRKSDVEDNFISTNALLYPHFLVIFFSLHLLYEDMKLNELKINFLPSLVKLLHQLATDLQLVKYIHHYWMDYPSICPYKCRTTFDESRNNIIKPSYFTNVPPNIYKHFYEMMLKRNVEPYPYMVKVNNRTKDLIQIIGLLSYGYDNPGIDMNSLVKYVSTSSVRIDSSATKMKSPRSRSHRPIPHRVILLMTQMGITQDNMQTLPPAISLIIHEALYSCRDNPGFGWSKEAYKLAMRHDLASFCRQNSKEEVGPTNELIMPSACNNCKSNNTIRLNMDPEEDGLEDLSNMDVLKLRFSSDQRVLEARRMLQSAQPVRITIQQRPDVSDHEFMQEQEKHLYAICTRTMALPVGRGMMTLRTAMPVITEKLPIPPLCLTGRVPPTDKVVDMSHIEVAPNINQWPLFHNGVAAGLRISPSAPDIDSMWIIYNKPKTNNDELVEHAGFLMALGLNGHLKKLLDTSIYRYLIKDHEMTSVGLLLGIAASLRGTMDMYTVKIVSLHIEAMLPPTGIEMDINVVVEPTALISLGFLYQGTAHRHIAQVLLQEIGRPPGPEMDNSVDRESYSLAAGLALGLVVFGRGEKLSGLGDMAIADTLHHYMVGGPKRPYLGSQREKYRTPSFLIWEGDLVNTHVTGPGASLALGMLYFNTGNKAIADWLKAPETQHLLEMVLPDALLLRTLARGLILWQDIKPTEEWILSHVPAFTRPYCLVKPQQNVDKDIDYETMNQAYCNIVAGACMAIGLRFAGSAYEEAFDVLLSFAKKFTSLLGKSIAELCGKSTIETCLNVITVSLAMVMAGTGDLEVLRLCRYLRSRVGPTNTVVTYGSHLATHMAIGLLFLGGGAYTLSTSPDSIAALLCAFYPKWPIHSNDNRYHLQALRHLYVLAVEPRLLLPRDIDTRTLCYAHITCIYLDVPLYNKKMVKMRAPCLLPELNLLKEVRIEDDRYWSITFTREKNWDDFVSILTECSFVDVKQKAGCLSYLEDPQGFRSLLAQTLTSEDVIPWTVPVETIFGFSSDPILVNFTQYFLERRDGESTNNAEDKIVTWLTYIAYYCLTKDKLSLLPLWVSLLKCGQTLFLNPSSSSVWQLKLMWTQALRSSGCNNSSPLIPPDMALSVKQHFRTLFEAWEDEIMPLIKNYVTGKMDPESPHQDKLSAYLTFHDIPQFCELHDLNTSEGRSKIFQYLTSNQLSASTIFKISSIIKNLQRC